jgi:hypothetical protein
VGNGGRTAPTELPLSLRVFGRLPFTGVRGRTEAGVGKAWKEETAGEFAPTLVSTYGEFAGAG